MAKILEKRWGVFGWGVAASVLLHLTVAGLFFLKLPEQQQKPEDEAVSVELVPPPEEQKAEEKKPEEKPPELKMPEEPKPEEKKAEEKPAEKPPETPKEEAKAEEPPPPPPPPPPPEKPKPPEEKPPEQKPPEQPKAEQQKPEEPTKQAADGGQPQPIQPLRPVFEFGDKDSGPRKSDTGDASADSAKPIAKPPTEELEPKPAQTAAAKPPTEDKPPANPVPDDVDLPQVDAGATHAEKNGPPAEPTGEAKTAFEQAKPTEVAKAETTDATKSAPDALTEAKTLFSRNATDDPVAKTAMNDLSRGMRVAELCTTELREQLLHSPSGYRPELLPSYRLSSGTVLEVKRGAFRGSGRWYDMSYRCEVDADATKVMSFAFDVGDPVPKSQWRSRGFPQ
ncbi:DUF930 domain-containing protein [Rhizobium sp. Root1220]|uniref:DUF930 domain-containing protein n=1 Tax=Rhizobium sp. Root1220 TaxID=1736432 RepID=UPI0006F48878|nr:DUF930 domain-containing protein [Rhizobium sp. Root1220]KQV64448.1 hypothetical protein ASC90_16290 [Rhizobium sp. Root1220]